MTWSESHSFEYVCANMRSNNLNKYAIFHFIMHICHSLSARLLLLLHSYSWHEEVWGRFYLIAPSAHNKHFMYIMCMWHIWILFFSSLFLHANSHRCCVYIVFKREKRGERKKMLIKINSNDKSTEKSEIKKCPPANQLDVKRATKECKGER